MSEAQQFPVYKAAPIFERVITAYVEMEPEQFAEKEATWKGKAIHAFPYFNPRVEWDINLEQKEGGVPVLAEAGPTMKIHDWFFEHPQKENRGFAHQSDLGKFGINLLRDGDKIFHFRDVETKFKEWLPKWAEHFGVTSFTGAALDYVDYLNRKTVPDFYEGGRLHVGNVIKIFSAIPGPHVTLVPPYDCQVNMLLDEKMPATGQIRIRNGPFEGLRLEMQMRSLSNKEKKTSTEELLAEVLALHRWMNIYFEALFTDEAKKSFKHSVLIN